MFDVMINMTFLKSDRVAEAIGQLAIFKHL